MTLQSYVSQAAPRRINCYFVAPGGDTTLIPILPAQPFIVIVWLSRQKLVILQAIR